MTRDPEREADLDPTSYPEFRDRILRAEQEGIEHAARSYPGYPRIPLPRARGRVTVGLDRALATRRCHRDLGTEPPSRVELARLLQYAHGVNESRDRGPTPSSGGMQSLELYPVPLTSTWLEAGVYHYDRAGHFLSRLEAGAAREGWEALVPSMAQFTGGGLLWLIVGDGARIERKYGPRGRRFLCLEAGHLMQNLCLLSTTLGLVTLPLGGFYEREIAAHVGLPGTDRVLYLGACGAA